MLCYVKFPDSSLESSTLVRRLLGAALPPAPLLVNDESRDVNIGLRAAETKSVFRLCSLVQWLCSAVKVLLVCRYFIYQIDIINIKGYH